MTGAATAVVRAGMARSLTAFLGRYPGLSVDALLAEAGIGPAELAEPDATLSLPPCVAMPQRPPAPPRHPRPAQPFRAPPPL